MQSESVSTWPFALVAGSFVIGAALGRDLGLRRARDPRTNRTLWTRIDDNLFALLGLVLGGVVVWFLPHAGHVLFDPPPAWSTVGSNERWAFFGYAGTLAAYPLLMFMLLYFTTARVCADDPPLAGRWLPVWDRVRRAGLLTAFGGVVPAALLCLAWTVANNAWQTATNRYFTIVCVLWFWGTIAAAGRLVDVFLRGTGLRLAFLSGLAIALGVSIATARDLPISQEGSETGPGELTPLWLEALNHRIRTIDPEAADCSAAAGPAAAETTDPNRIAPPLLFVAAAGGGSRAAVYVTLVLSLLDRPLAEIASIHDEDSNLYADLPQTRTAYEHVVLMSGVSGGSVGIANFASRRAQVTDVGEGECALKNVFCKEVELALGPPAAGSFESIVARPVVDDVFVDFMAPFMVGLLDPRVGRGERLAQWWKDKLKWDEGIHAQPAGTVPLLLFNAVVASQGSRVVFGKPAITGELLGNPDEVRPSPQSGMRLQLAGELAVEDAVRISASFPFGMDLATVGDESLIDGGVLDNSGTDAIGSMFEGLDQLAVGAGPHQTQASCLVRSLRSHPLVVLEVDSGAKPTSIDDNGPSSAGDWMAHSNSITAAMWRRERSAVGAVNATVRRFGQDSAKGSRWIAFPYLPGLAPCKSTDAATEDVATTTAQPDATNDDGVITTWALGPNDKRALVHGFRDLVVGHQGVLYVDGDCLAPPVPALLDAFVKPEFVPDDLRAHRAWEGNPQTAAPPAAWSVANVEQLAAMFGAISVAADDLRGNLGPEVDESSPHPTTLWIPIGAVRGTRALVLSNHPLARPPRLELTSKVDGTLTRPVLAFESARLDAVPLVWLPKGFRLEGKLVQTDPGGGGPRVAWIGQASTVQRAACATPAIAEIHACVGAEPAVGLTAAAALIEEGVYAPACVLVAKEQRDCAPWASEKANPQVLLFVAEPQLGAVKKRFTGRDDIAVRPLGDPGSVLATNPPPGTKSASAPAAKPAFPEAAGMARPGVRTSPPTASVLGEDDYTLAPTLPKALTTGQGLPDVALAYEAPLLSAQQMVVTTLPIRLFLEQLTVQAVPRLEGALEVMVTMHLLSPGKPRTEANAHGGSPHRFAKDEVYRSVAVNDTSAWHPIEVYRDTLASGKSTVIRWDLEDHDLNDGDGQEVSEIWVTVGNEEGRATLACSAFDPKADEIKVEGTKCHVSTRSETGFALRYAVALR